VNPNRLILLAEDDEIDVMFLERAFAQAEIANPLYVAPDGQAAIDYLANVEHVSDRGKHPLPCLILLDLKMPRRGGMEVLRWIRQDGALRGIPVIMLSSSVNPSEIQTAYEEGANAFVTKPSGTAERTELAKSLKGFWLTFNQLP
jgi:CheY-like chemotaxis protein